MSKVIETCPHCQQPFELGYTGTEAGCDVCTGVKRDKEGHAWYADETYHVYANVGNEKRFTLKLRPNALS